MIDDLLRKIEEAIKGFFADSLISSLEKLTGDINNTVMNIGTEVAKGLQDWNGDIYPDVFGIGDRWACASWFQIDANRLHDTALSDFLDMDGALMVSIHLQPVNQEKAIRTVKSKISDIDSMKASQNKKAVEQGIDMDIMPTDINTYGAEARELLDGLQTKDERYFLITVIIVNLADTKSKLESAVAQAKSIAQQHNCSLRRFRFQQEQAFQSALPLGKNHVPVKRGMTTTGVGILVPFITEDIYMGKGSLHYGRNPLSQRLTPRGCRLRAVSVESPRHRGN